MTNKEDGSFYVKAIQAYKSRKKGELSFKKGQIIEVTETNPDEFLHYGNLDGKEGDLTQNIHYLIFLFLKYFKFCQYRIQ